MFESAERQVGKISFKQQAGFWESSYFPALDGLRALSLLLVVGGHVRTTLAIKNYISGGLGVGIFFVLSGFLITTLLLREHRSSGTLSIRAFYVRRCFRIIPLYLFTVILYLLIGSLPSQHDLRTKFLTALPYDLTFRNEYIPSHLSVAFTHSWSLSVEEKFYFVWPFLFLLLLRQKSLRLAIILITFAPLLISTTATLPVAYFSLLSGCCIAFLLDALRLSQESTKRTLSRIPMILMAAIWVGSYFVSINGKWRIAFIVTTALILPKLLIETTWLSKILGLAPLRWVGKRTYSMYLVHALCLGAVETHLATPNTAPKYMLVIFVAFLVSLGVASITYSLIEQPLISVGRRISKRISAVKKESAVSKDFSVANVN